MTEKHMSFGTQSICLNVDNQFSEEKLENKDTMISSASDFQVNLCPTLDITNLLFLKSQDAEICNTELTINSSPLTFVEHECIYTYLKVPTKLLKTNRFFNTKHVEKWNTSPLRLTLSNYSAETNEEGLAYLSSLVSQLPQPPMSRDLGMEELDLDHCCSVRNNFLVLKIFDKTWMF